MLRSVAASGFVVEDVAHDAFAFRFADAAALFDHAFFRRFQLPHLRQLVAPDRQDDVFDELGRRLDALVRTSAELKLSVPFVAVSARRISD